MYEQYQRSVYRRARTLLADEDAAQDVLQEVFLKALRVPADDPLIENPMGWFYRTTTNLCLNRLRNTKRRRQLLAEPGTELVFAPDADASMIVKRILEALPEELQAAAIFYYIDELSHDEIAVLLGTSRRTVGNRLATFRSHVLKLMSFEVVL
jgi:RNA polymerase sigma factor (sigma-70 family)